jgi:hypothetical protein
LNFFTGLRIKRRRGTKQCQAVNSKFLKFHGK